MSDLLNGWTVTGAIGVIVSIILAVWRRSTPQPGVPPWYVKVARLGSAVVRLQISEGTLDSVKESLLLEREESALLRIDLRACREENAQLRSLVKTDSSGASSDGSIASPTARTRKKPTT